MCVTSSYIECENVESPYIGEWLLAAETRRCLLAAVLSEMLFQAAFLAKCHLAAIFWADERFITRMCPFMPFKIGLPLETLLLVRRDFGDGNVSAYLTTRFSRTL
jgi:hypothetical protein